MSLANKNEYIARPVKSFSSKKPESIYIIYVRFYSSSKYVQCNKASLYPLSDFAMPLFLRKERVKLELLSENAEAAAVNSMPTTNLKPFSARSAGKKRNASAKKRSWGQANISRHSGFNAL